jgi:nucleotide-binding universal stress UspA family protein
VKRILVPLDGSKLSEEALTHAIGIAQRHCASLELVHIVPDLLAQVSAARPGPASFEQWLEDEEVRARNYLESLTKGLKAEKGVEVSTHAHVRIGFVAESILELANNLGVDLIVLTTHGKGRWERVWIGSVADQLLRSAEQPLLLFKPGESGARTFTAGYPRRVLVPLDGAPQGEAVLVTLRALCSPESSRLDLVSVLPEVLLFANPVLPPALAGPLAGGQSEEGVREYLSGLNDRLRSWGFQNVHSRVLHRNDVARCLLEIAEDEGADLIAVSTHGRGGVGRLVLGSVVDKLVRGSATAVLTVRRRAEAAP